MDGIARWRRLVYAFVGQVYLLAYLAAERRLFGIRVRTLITLLTAFLVVTAWGQTWDASLQLFTILVFAWVQFVWWRTKRDGYIKFQPDSQQAIPPNPQAKIPREQRVPLRATGTFSVRDHSERVLLGRAEYWQVPVGDHVVMVEPARGRFLYQFFSGTTLEQVRSGWLLLGRKPLRTLAISFWSTWEPEKTEFGRPRYFAGHTEKDSTARLTTIYFSFADVAARRRVWHNILRDTRRAT